MEAHWWCCVLGLLCVPAGGMLSTSTVSQDPTSISLTKVNSSVEITCSTSLLNPVGLYLHRYFPDKRTILFLALQRGLVTKTTPASEFAGRIRVAPHQRLGQAHGFTLQLSLLGLGDTNLYFCSWEFFKEETSSQETLTGPSTAIIVRERDAQDQCRDHVLDRILMALSVVGFSVVVSLCIAALILKCKQFKRTFRPARAAKAPRPNRPPHICPQHGVQHDPYLITSVNSLDFESR